MMQLLKNFLVCLLVLSNCYVYCQVSVSVTEVGNLTESVANNAVCEGFINGDPYIYSFGGIDSTKSHEGIHLRSFRYNIATGVSERIPDMPDNMGKIAAGASRIGDIIYIIGGYYVFANGSESSSRKVHRYDIINNEFLDDGAYIPLAIDDHVQVVYNDSLIYVVTGWSNSANVRNVQIYDPSQDTWSVGTPTPNSNNYKSFGASGTIINNTITYFGGATSGFGFGPQRNLRSGIINPDNPSEIAWSETIPDISITGYRMACTQVNNVAFWIGGSANTYNYDGIAYDGTGGVSPTNRILYKSEADANFSQVLADEIPMDLRGIAKVSDENMFIAGGMGENQEVTNKIYSIAFSGVSSNHNVDQLNAIKISPNPFFDELEILTEDISQVRIYTILGQLVLEKQSSNISNMDVSTLDSGVYFVEVEKGEQKFVKKMLKND